MTKKERSQIRLGRVELQIMNVVWENETATVHDVKEALSIGQKPAYSTILTMMRKLETKGYLEHDVYGRTYVYRPVISKKVVCHSVLRDILNRLFEDSPSLLLNSLIEQDSITEKELLKARKLIRERERNE